MLVVGEAINATSKKVRQAIADRNQEFLQNLAREQDARGVDFIDINVGGGEGLMEEAVVSIQWLVETVQQVTDKPLAIDSDSPQVIKAGLEKHQGDRVMINSVSAEEGRMETILPLVAEREALLVALAEGSEGVPDNVEGRLATCDRIMDRAKSYGVNPENIFFDPVLLPISVAPKQGMIALKAVEKIKIRHPEAKTIMGLSNISYGLPARKLVNRGAFLMAAYAGLDAVILDPRDSKIMAFIKVADLLTGSDPYCKGYIKAHRKGLLTE